MIDRRTKIDLSINNFTLAGVSLADTWLTRLVGLLRTDKTAFKGLLISPCSSVHTIGMRYAIDVIFIDGNRRVSKLCKNIEPMRFCFGTHDTTSTLELPTGTIEALGLNIGDEISTVKKRRAEEFV